MDKTTIAELRQKYPSYVPVRIAAPLLGMSERQLSRLVSEGRQPFASIGANIGIRQRYVRIYTERLIGYLCGNIAE